MSLMPIYSNWDLAVGNEFSFYKNYFVKLIARVKIAHDIDEGYPKPKPTVEGLVLLHIAARSLSDAVVHAYEVVPDLLKKKYDDMAPNVRTFGCELWFEDGKEITMCAPLYNATSWAKHKPHDPRDDIPFN